jgi:hypothetical protein
MESLKDLEFWDFGIDGWKDGRMERLKDLGFWDFAIWD